MNKEHPKQEPTLEETARLYSEEDMAESFMACWKANVPEGFECKLSFNDKGERKRFRSRNSIRKWNLVLLLTVGYLRSCRTES